MNNSCDQTPGLIEGDKFTGLSIAGEENRIYQFELDGQQVTVRQSTARQAEDRIILDLEFSLAAPVRLRVDVLVPDDCQNACVTLNDQLLINWFDSKKPVTIPEIQISGCQEKGEGVSTLQPGRFQSISFKWFDRDRLRFYFIRPALTEL